MPVTSSPETSSRLTANPVLLADIGGTNARFTVLADGKLGETCTLPTADHAEPGLAARTAIERLGGTAPRAALLAVAGPVRQNRATMTNLGWEFDGAALAGALGLDLVRIVNDFEALAWSLPRLQPEDLLALGGGAADPAAPLLVVGPGTGLGAGALVPVGTAGNGGAVVLASEGGHISLAAEDAREAAVLERLRAKFGRVSAERALSGPGLENLYAALGAIDGVAAPPRGAAEITTQGLDGSCPLCRATLELFCRLLGAYAGDLALAFGAKGGVFVGGGILPRIAEFLRDSGFRAGFEAKGRMSGYNAAIPAHLILRKDPALVGLANLAETLSGNAGE